MTYIAMRNGVRFDTHVFAKGDEIPAAVVAEFPGAVRRSLINGKLAEAATDRVPDWSSASKEALLEEAGKRGVIVEGSGTDGSVLKRDLVEALGAG